MYSSNIDPITLLGNFHIDGAMFRYSQFVPRFYNLCKSLGFESGKIMPSRAFCSDESQGYPVILITKHFGTFPFNHGRVGGIVATDRHGPHADHGQDMVIIQSSHVGYDDATKTFGIYRRTQTRDNEVSPSCGKSHAVLDWYVNEYNFAKESIYLSQRDNKHLITIDNQLLDENRENGLFLNLDRIVQLNEEGEIFPVKSYSTSKSYIASEQLNSSLKGYTWPKTNQEEIGEKLQPDLFRFKRDIDSDVDGTEGSNQLERNLIKLMPWIITSESPLLAAAKVNTQIEFDRTFRTIIKEKGYNGKKLIFISGLNIDISPKTDQVFPLTKFVPWAAYVQEKDGTHYILEQPELVKRLNQQSMDNPDQIDLEDAIQQTGEVKEIKIAI